MHTSKKEEEGFALVERGPSGAVNEELRFQEEDPLHCTGDGLFPGLTKAYRAPNIAQRPLTPT